MILVLIKVIQSNLSRHRDAYIHTNSLAILGNMSFKIKNMSPSVALKFIK